MVPDAFAVETKPEVFKAVKEHVLENCWMVPPCSVYSRTETDSTYESTMSGITGSNKSPAKNGSKFQGDEAWNALIGQTDTLEKAAEDIAEAEKKYQEERTKQWEEAKKNREEALKEVEEKQVEVLNNFKQQSEKFTRSLISENFDKLLKKSEEIKAKSTELEE
eukprot:15340191-Ditylum_brightwellii.AAC.1